MKIGSRYTAITRTRCPKGDGPMVTTSVFASFDKAIKYMVIAKALAHTNGLWLWDDTGRLLYAFDASHEGAQ